MKTDTPPSEFRSNDFDELVQIAQHEGVAASLNFLEQRFRADKKFFQLFEVLKMQCRHRLGLPLIYGTRPDELDEERQRQLEDVLLAACTEIGTLLIANGQLEQGWMYLQPVGNRALIEKVIRDIPVDSENIGTVIEIAVSQGAAPVYGFGLLMEHYGTCNAITTIDTQGMRFDQPTQKGMAELLLRHLYRELCANLHRLIERSEKSTADPTSLAGLLTEHSWLIEGGAHHIDATHLASVMRIARVVDETDDLRRALELANYGSGLQADFQYASPAPFEQTYPDHQFFYAGLLGHDTPAAIQHFTAKCHSVDPERFGGVALETLADFLMRVGRTDAAIAVLTEQLLGKHEPLGIAPQIFQLAETPDQLAVVQKYFLQNEDLLSFGISLLQAKIRS